jgi:drug/metabolite transporter (DMT)-like permease
MRSRILKSPLPYLALIIAHTIWGANFAVAKLTLREFPVMSLGFLRFAFACILLIPFLLAENRKVRIRVEHLPKLVLIGLSLVTFNIVFFYLGLLNSTAINASALQLIIPLLSIVGCWIFLREKIYRINLFGILLGFVGTLIIIGLPLIFIGDLSGKTLLGNFLLILSSISFVIGAIMSRKMLKFYPPLVITTIAFLVGMLSFLLPAVNDYLVDPAWVNKVTVLGVLGLLYISILSSVSAYFLFQWALERVGVIQANIFQYFEPAIAVAIAVPFLGERISFSFIVGTVLVILGVYWGTLGKPEHHHPHHKHHRT